MLRRGCVGLGRLAAAAIRQQEGVSTSGSQQEHLQQVWRTTAAGAHLARMSTNSHDHFNVYREGPDNKLNTEFDFTEENYERAAEIMSHYPTNYKSSAVIPLLTLAQNQNQGWLNLAAMNRVAKVLGMAPIRVYEVATFYTMFNRSKMGKYHVMVCGTTPCMLCGARSIYQAIKDHLGIDYGQTTKDGMFTFGEMECMGSCVNAPMIAVADYTKGVDGFSYNYYEDLSPSDAIKILEELKAGKNPRLGSQYRKRAEPAGSVNTGSWVPRPEGERTLTFESTGGKPSGPFCRNLDEPPPEAPPAKA